MTATASRSRAGRRCGWRSRKPAARPRGAPDHRLDVPRGRSRRRTLIGSPLPTATADGDGPRERAAGGRVAHAAPL